MSLEASTSNAASVQIVGVHTDLGSDLIRANLELPQEGGVTRGFWLPLSGWVFSPSGERVDVRISDRWRGLRMIPRQIERPDIAAAFPDVANADRTGFSIALGTTRLPEQFDLWLSALVGEVSIRFALVRGARRRFPAMTGSPPVSPLAVTTLGRTGSTLLMTLLSHHPGIWAYDPPSHDSRPFAHALAAATALSTPGSRLQLLESRGAGGEWWLEGAPLPVARVLSLSPDLQETLLGNGVAQLLGAAVRQGASTAHELAVQGGKANAAYAAEKCAPDYVPRLLHELCPESREIFLVRDFRDQLASIFAFNAKRGYAAFGREDVTTDQEFVERFSNDASMLTAAWTARRDHAHLVRYEDLISDPPAVLAQILAYLTVETSDAELAEIADASHRALAPTKAGHATTAVPSQSTGRWQHDLPEDLGELASVTLGHALKEFGYE